jgi:hypothetical protein
VYQKQYLEFFCPPAALDKVIAVFESFPSVVYMAQRRDKTGRRSNMPNFATKWISEGNNNSNKNDNSNGDNNNEDENDSSPQTQQRQRNRVLKNQTDQVSLTALLGLGGSSSNNVIIGEKSKSSTSPLISNANNNNINNNQNYLHAAVTWGVFPSKDIVQPTFVSSSAFDIWTPEAFTMWLYPFHGITSDEQVPQVIQDIVDSWYLVTALDNDYNNSSVKNTASPVTSKSPSALPSSASLTQMNQEGVVVSTPLTENPPPVTSSSQNWTTPLNEAVNRICAILPEI